MTRRDLTEIEDWPPLPAWLRDAITGYLRVALSVGKPYATAAPVLAELLRERGETRIVDLASGGGGPWPELVVELERLLGQPPAVTRTDIHPNRTAAVELERLASLRARDPDDPVRPAARARPHAARAAAPPASAHPHVPAADPADPHHWWDGFASTLCTHRAEELRALVREIEEPGYACRVEKRSVPGAPIPVTLVVGRPIEGRRPHRG